MKILYFLLFAILFISIQNLQAQAKESFVSIKKKNETYFVSGIVVNEIVRNEIVETVKNAAAAKVVATELKIDGQAGLPVYEWKKNLEKQIAKTKNSETAFFRINFSREDSFPEMPAGILNSEILLTANNGKIKLADYKNETVILSIVAHWAGPAQRTASVLNQLYDENLKNTRIIAVNVDEKGYEDSYFLEFVEKMNAKFQTGWANKKFISDLAEITKFQGIPQTFIIKNGKLRGIFLGSGNKVNETFIETARKVSGEN